MARSKLLLLASLILLTLATPVSARDTSIAVVVNPGNPAESVSLSQLRGMFLGTQTFWKDGVRVFAVVRAPSARERTALLRSVLHMSEAQYQQYWRKKRQEKKGSLEPVAMVSNPDQIQAVMRDPGAVALIATTDLNSSVKVLKVGGVLPGRAAYPLKSSAVR